MELMLEDILDFCTGKQEDGTPMAGSSISVFGLTKAKPVVLPDILCVKLLCSHDA